jgi:small nuclear ribonucleoprotein (snRNP)-like protein
LTQLLFGLLVCYDQVENYFLIDCSKIVPFITNYRERYIKQDRSKIRLS